MSTVLIAVDGSSQAEHALQYYIDNLHREENKVLLVFCIEPLKSFSETDASSEVYRNMLDQKEQKVKQIEEKCKPRLNAKNIEAQMVTLMSYRPGEVIVEQASKDKATMIVMGTRGQGTIRRTLMGSVSDYVVHHAHCPVIICRQ